VDVVPLSLSSPQVHLRAWHDLNVQYWQEEVPVLDPPGPLESRSELDSDRTARRGGLLAFEGDTVTGAAIYELPLLEDLDEAYVWLFVPRPFRRRGYGRGLLSAARATVASAGRCRLRGDARADGAGAGFATAVTARATQVDVGSVLDVATVDGDELAAHAVVDHAYELVDWRDRCPDDLLDRFAIVRMAMNDAPKGDEPRDEWQWDAQRERDREAHHARWGARSYVTAAVDRVTGDVAGFTELLVNERPTTAQQEDTAVLAAHRGHGLGLSLKAANLIRLRADEPQITKVLTWNAETNRHMRAVNERLGFRVLNRWLDLSLTDQGQGSPRSLL
jgi:GNAT superfamily N-acetyltransferase